MPTNNREIRQLQERITALEAELAAKKKVLHILGREIAWVRELLTRSVEEYEREANESNKGVAKLFYGSLAKELRKLLRQVKTGIIISTEKRGEKNGVATTPSSDDRS